MRVLKFGGASLASPAHVKSIANKLAQFHKNNESLIVVVSAMGSTTNDLIQLAQQISPNPPARELDMLISTGERVAMSLMSMALKDQGCPAISFTGSQAGILTDDCHSEARIQKLTPYRVQEQLESGRVVVLAGFQGVCPTTKEITTLGRGGSDTTAVALAAHFKAKMCEIRKEVSGFFSMDPKRSSHAKHFANLSINHLLSATFWGAQLLHPRSAALAKKFNVPLLIGSTDFNSPVTLVSHERNPDLEQEQFTSAHLLPATLLTTQQPDEFSSIDQIQQLLDQYKLPMPRILMHQLSRQQKQFQLLLNFEAHFETQSLEALRSLFAYFSTSKVQILSLIGLTGHTANSLNQSLKVLEQIKIQPLMTFTQPQQLQFVLTEAQAEDALLRLHDYWIKNKN